MTNIFFEFKISIALGLQILRHRYSDTYFSIFWFFLSPIAFPLIVFFFLPLKSSENPLHLYIIFSGYSHWFLFSSTVLIFLRAFRPLKRYFVHGQFSFFSFFLAIFLGPCLQSAPLFLILFSIAQAQPMTTNLVNPMFWLISIAITVVTSFSIGMLLAVINLKTRDIKFGAPYVLAALTFTLPIFYPLQTSLAEAFLAFPLVTAIELTRNNQLFASTTTYVYLPVLQLCLMGASAIIINHIFTRRKSDIIIAMETLSNSGGEIEN